METTKTIRQRVPSGVFAPDQVRATDRRDATTRAANDIIDAEARLRAEKTARLRALRQASVA